MSDFDDIVMPEETPAEEPTPEVAPEPPAWEKAGYSSEDEALAALTKINEERKRINDEKSELGRLKKQIEQERFTQPAAPVSDDLFEQLDPAVAKQLKEAIQREAQMVVAQTVGPQARVAEELFNTTAEQLFKTTAENAGIESDDLYAFMQENNLFPAAPSIDELAKKLDFATAAYKGKNLDAEVDKRVAEELAKLKKEGAEVKAVSPAAKKEPSSDDPDEFEKMGFAEKLKAIATGKL